MKTDVTLPDETQQPPAPTGDESAAARPEPPRKLPVRSPFVKAKGLQKRLKLFLWGDSGVGKTTLALRFPKPVVIDMEGGTDLYGDAFEFEVLRTITADEAMEAVDWLLKSRHDHRTRQIPIAHRFASTICIILFQNDRSDGIRCF